MFFLTPTLGVQMYGIQQHLFYLFISSCQPQKNYSQSLPVLLPAIKDSVGAFIGPDTAVEGGSI